MMWSRLVHRALLAALLSGAAGLGAQAPAPPTVALLPGDRVRIDAANMERRLATVYALHGDTLLLRGRRPATPWAFPLASATSIDVSRGRQSRTMRGALIGLLGGAVITGVTAYAIADPSTRCEDSYFFVCEGTSRLGEGIVGGITGGLVGAVVGGIYGARHPSHRWERVYPPPGAGGTPRQGGAP